MFFRFVVLLALTVSTRFFGLFWGSGYFFHPDENNMVSAIMQMSPGNYNPHFFAYGQFPLYLGYFTQSILGLHHTFTVITYILRFWSALFSSLSVLVFYLIVKKIFNTKVATLASLIYIFTPGLIQLSHFGTTESLLVLVFLANIYLSFHLLDHPLNYKIYFTSALITGIGIGSKLSSLVFLFPILLLSLINLLKHPQKLRILLFTFYFLLFTLIIFIILSPYNVIDRPDFISALKYETDVATGRLPVFYTTQFFQTKPYMFQLTHIFPYVLGIPMFVFSLFGLMSFIHSSYFIHHKSKIYLSIILSSCSIYFLYFGQLYVKWTRFMSPILFLFPLLAAYLLSKIKNKLILTTILLFSTFPGIYFMKLYLQPDIRLTATSWLIDNVPADSTILSEGGNVVDIPVADHQYKVINYDFYNYDSTTLTNQLANSDYIIVPSRRVFMNYHLPYYQHLFDGSLGFQKIKSFAPSTDILLNPENAEETWSVFDRPTIRIYQKIKQLDQDQYEAILKS